MLNRATGTLRCCRCSAGCRWAARRSVSRCCRRCPIAYFVNGDTGLKQTTEINWTNKYLNIEEIATILPVPDNVVADVDANIWDQAMPYLVEAFGRTLDAATFFGTNAPGTWPTNVSAAAARRGQLADRQRGGDRRRRLRRPGRGVRAARRRRLRPDRHHRVDRLEGPDPAGPRQHGSAPRPGPGERHPDQHRRPRRRYPMRGLWPAGSGGVYSLVGDWSQFVVGVRQDITMKILDQAVITDNTGAIIYNLPQQDMTAIRLTFRVGWQVANIINYDQAVEANRYPVARILIP
jgi:hypothetical protein